MITVKLIGGAKKSFLKDEILIEKDSISLDDLLNYLISIKPENSATFDISNVLVAINGVDSSALSGRTTVISNNDVVSIIPVIHGGSSKRLNLTLSNRKILLMEIKDTSLDHTFLDSLRTKFPKVIVQAISNNFILGKTHFTKILSISIESQNNDTLLSDKFETDILLRFAGTTQISKAIKDLGIKKGQGSFLICIGNKSDLESVYDEMHPKLSELFSKNNKRHLEKYFKITKKHYDSVLSKTPLEDILAEKGAVLF